MSSHRYRTDRDHFYFERGQWWYVANARMKIVVPVTLKNMRHTAETIHIAYRRA